MMAGRHDNPFEVRLGRIRSASGHRRVTGFFKQIGRGARRISSGKRGYRQTQRALSASASFQRRVLIKVHIQKMAAIGAKTQALHLKYIERDNAAREDEPGRLYNDVSDEVDRGAFEERGREDRHQFRVIVSPEDAHELSDLRAYTRDLVKEMERDLGTRLDWVAADHYDTDQPHTHMVIRGKREDGQDLVIPKKYVAHGIRGRAQELAELELGPVTEIAGRTRLARMTGQERFTELDRRILARSDKGIVDLSNPVSRNQLWRRQLEKKRLQSLQKMGLAENLGQGRWRIHPEARATLTRMGERGDIIKAMHRAMRETGEPRLVDSAALFDPASENAKPVTGKIIAKGIADDVSGRAYIVMDSMEGKAVYVDIGKSERLFEFEKNQIVIVRPPSFEPRASDRTLDAIASKHSGRYSPNLHMSEDKSARPQFVEAHVRRLEALRRAGHVSRQSDGSWVLPRDYLDRAARYQRDMALRRPIQIDASSKLSLRQMSSALGATWLDEQLAENEEASSSRGFGGEVEAARTIRRQFLFKEGFLNNPDSKINEDVLKSLEAHDLKVAGRTLSGELGKPYSASPQLGRISGIYSKAIDRPSGRYAVIERAKDFTLVPWRDVMDRNLGKSISGVIRGKSISWTLTRGRGIS